MPTDNAMLIVRLTAMIKRGHRATTPPAQRPENHDGLQHRMLANQKIAQRLYSQISRMGSIVAHPMLAIPLELSSLCSLELDS